MPAQTVIKSRAGTASQWTSANPVLAVGEMGVETDTRKFKFGTGAAAWSSISYAVGSVALEGVVIDWVDIVGKPTTFAPSTHTHVIADITDYVEPEITFTNNFMMMGA
jgi:hypothetical protein